MTLHDAVMEPRPQHTFKNPDYIRSEKEDDYELADDIRAGLEQKGHEVKRSRFNAVIQAIYVEDDKIHAQTDPRKDGKAAGY